MKRSYILFGFVLVVLILGFSFTKSYLQSLEEDAKWKQKSAALRTEIDSLEQELRARMGEAKAFSPSKAEEGEPQVAVVTNDTPATQAVVVPEKVAEPTSAPAESRGDLAAAANDSAAEPTPDELVLYRKYVQKRLSLPSVIRAKDLEQAKSEILSELGKAYGISSEQVSKIVDKVYEHRRQGSGN